MGRTWNMSVVSILRTWVLILYYSIISRHQSFVPRGNCWQYLWKPSENVLSSVKENMSLYKKPDLGLLSGPRAQDLRGLPASHLLSASPSDSSQMTDFILLLVSQKPSATLYSLESKAPTSRALNRQPSVSVKATCLRAPPQTDRSDPVSMPPASQTYVVPTCLYLCPRGFSLPGYHLICLCRSDSESQGKA